MEELLPMIPGWLLVMVALCLIGLVAMAGMAVFIFLFKAGVVIHEARKPPYIDAGDYRIEQGREVRPETAARRDSHEGEPR